MYYLTKFKHGCVSIIDSIENLSQVPVILKKNFDVDGVVQISDPKKLKIAGTFVYPLDEFRYAVSQFERVKGYIWNGPLKETKLFNYQIVYYAIDKNSIYYQRVMKELDSVKEIGELPIEEENPFS